VVLAAQGQSAIADEALEKLCRTYWRPLYAFIRRQGFGPEEAQDLTQSFFARLLRRRDLDVVRREKGRLRSYLLVSLVDERDGNKCRNSSNDEPVWFAHGSLSCCGLSRERLPLVGLPKYLKLRNSYN
jgi:hypothetical protein